MHRQAEGAPVHRQEGSAAQQFQGLERVFRSEVNVAPGRMEGTHLQHHEIEGPETFTDRLVLRRETGVAAEEHRVPRTRDDDPRPQPPVATPPPTPPKTPRR